jgi:transcriptional regulator with XRE-family HTH domain
MSREKLKKARKDAGLTQQQMADKLDISIVYYQKIEQGSRTGDFTLWDTLEDITGVHQRILREIEDNHPGKESNL